MKTNSVCPSCGESVEFKLEKGLTRVIKVDCYQSFNVTLDRVQCPVCGFKGSLDGKNEEGLLAAKKESDNQASNMLVDEITKFEKAASIERSLGLPARTFNRWRTQNRSSAALVLLKLVTTYPWLVKVAEFGYEPSVAKNELYAQAALLLHNDHIEASSDFLAMEGSVTNGGNSSDIFFASVMPGVQNVKIAG